MFGSGADEGCGEGTAVKGICRYLLKAGVPPTRVHSGLFKQYPSLHTTPPAHTSTPPALRSLHTQAAFLFCLPLSITYPRVHTAHTLPPSNLLPCVFIHLHLYAPHRKTLSITFPIPFLFSLLSCLTSTYSPQAWEHNPLNERIWLSKMNHKPKTSKLTNLPPTYPLQYQPS